ncbi:MAG: type II toxin-antitoxin system Phd/YefM family antitoxin [Candidatus Omnitrophota bacterium]|nr:type II toxin-antitoxin system Phd/YefM family antitoxin [Candidatus Omnitrophota bacterium]
MKFVTIRDFRSRSARIQRELPFEKEMVLTSNGKPVAIISTVSEADLEDTLTAIRRARASLAVTLLQSDSLGKGRSRMTPGEINVEIKAARKKLAG